MPERKHCRALLVELRRTADLADRLGISVENGAKLSTNEAYALGDRLRKANQVLELLAERVSAAEARPEHAWADRTSNRRPGVPAASE